jgi:hypothetical protein
MGQLEMQGSRSKRPFPKRKNLGQNPANDHCDDRERNGGGKFCAGLRKIHFMPLFEERGPAQEHDRGTFK